MSDIAHRSFSQFPSNLIFNLFIQLECQISPTGSSRSSHHRLLRGLRQLHREGSQHALWTRFHMVTFSQSAWKITAIFFIVVTITQLVHDCHYHRHNHYRIINKIIIITILSCYMGNSRCATIAAAYLMIKKDYSATQALQYMRNSRLLVVVMKLEKRLVKSFLPPNYMHYMGYNCW